MSRSVHDAFAAVARNIAATGSPSEQEYWRFHEARFRRTVQRLSELLPANAVILDVGSHFLHLAAILASLGFRVVALDVAAFAAMPHVQQRATSFSIDQRVVDFTEFADGTFLGAESDTYDAILLCEVIEHLTFNPVRFWKRAYELLRLNGVVYITTPNAMTLLAAAGAAWGLLTLSRIGLNAKRIMSDVTYGHHWKEYTAPELQRYFQSLTPDWDVQVRRFSLGDRPDPFTGRDLASRARSMLLTLGNRTGLFADQIEAVVTLRRREHWRAPAPDYA